MRSGTNCTITSGEVYSWSRECLLQAKLVKDHGRLCTAAVVLGVVLRAAARSISVSAACCDLGRGPSERAILTALDDGLPKTLVVLERRLNEALVGYLPRRCAVGPGRWRSTCTSTRTTGNRTRAATDLLRQSEAGDEQVSRLRFGLHRGIRTTLYVGPDVGAAPRIDGHGASPSVGENPRNWPENAMFAAGSRLFQRRSDGLASTGEAAVFDAREDFGATSEKGTQSNRPARSGGNRRAGTRIRCEAAGKR